MSADNRESCASITPSSCVPYTGNINQSFKTGLPCKPNINDMIELIENKIDSFTLKLGDNTLLDKKCTSILETDSQQIINQKILNELCLLKTTVTSLSAPIDPNDIFLSVNLLCLLDNNCDPQTEYSLLVIINKLITAYCNLLTRVTAIENFLNL